MGFGLKLRLLIKPTVKLDWALMSLGFGLKQLGFDFGLLMSPSYALGLVTELGFGLTMEFKGLRVN